MVLRLVLLRNKVNTKKLIETLLPEYREELTLLQHRKPDIVIIDETSRVIIIVEFTACFDLYFEFSFPFKCDRYQELCEFLREMVGNLLFMFCVLVRLAISKMTFMND